MQLQNKLYLSLKNPSLLLVLPIKEIKNKIKLINGAAANNKTPVEKFLIQNY